MFPTIASMGFGVLFAVGPANVPPAKAPVPIKLGPLERIKEQDRKLKELDKRFLALLAKERQSDNPRRVHETIKALDKVIRVLKQSKNEDPEIVAAFEAELAAWILLGKE